MKRLIVEASNTLSAYDKMKLVDKSQRKQNWSACSDLKLHAYYKICLEHNLTKAQAEAEQEIRKRRLWMWLAPRTYNIKGTFSAEKAQQVWDLRKTPRKFIEVANDTWQKTGAFFYGSEVLLRAYMLALAMRNSELQPFIDEIKKEIQYYNTYAFLMPLYLNLLLQDPAVVEQIQKAVNLVRYSA